MTEPGTDEVIIVGGDRLQNMEQADGRLDHRDRSANQARGVAIVSLFEGLESAL